MRVGAVPEGVVEWALDKLNLLPKPLADTFVAMMLCRTLMAASRVGVFEALARGARSADEVARELNCSPRVMARLLEALERLGYVVRRDGRYLNGRVVQRWLVSTSPHYLGGFLDFNYDLWEVWEHLEEVLRTGKAIEFHEAIPDHEGWRRYLSGMKDLARLMAPEIVRRIKLRPDARRFLDLAGGHGWMSILLCQRYPELHVTVLDLEPAVSIGREIVDREGMGHRISFVVGDLRTAGFGEDNDGILLSSIVHHFDEAQNRETVRRAYDSLKRGGVLVINDLLRDARNRMSQVTALLGLFFMISSRSDTFPPEAIAGWLKSAGFIGIQRHDLRMAPGFGLIIGTKP